MFLDNGEYTSALELLVDDILVDILCALSIADILAIRCTSKRLCVLTYVRHIWHQKFTQHVLSAHLPVPGPALALPSLPAVDLEWRTRRALRLQRGSVPPAVAVVCVSGAVDQVVLLLGGVQMLVVQARRVSCWNLRHESGGGAERAAEWTYEGDEAARVVQDASAPGVIAVGSPWSGRPVMILSVGSKPTFSELRYFSNVSGVIAGLHGRFLLLRTPAGGIDVIDWHTCVSESLPYYPDMFGEFVDSTVFSSHLLLFWERCVTTVPLPSSEDVANSTTLDHTQLFRFSEPITRPLALTPCLSADSTPVLTILARPQSRATGLLHSMLVPRTIDPAEPFPYGLVRLGKLPHSCAALQLGLSGRGLWLEEGKGKLQRCSPVMVVRPPQGALRTVSCGTHEPVCVLGESGDSEVDFDEGMGRAVVWKGGRGDVTIVDLA